jgi:hypothetical protein
VCPQATGISHLLFADDTLLFFRASEVEANHVKEALQRYARATRQLINPAKWSILFGPRCREINKQEVMHELEVENANFDAPSDYCFFTSFRVLDGTLSRFFLSFRFSSGFLYVLERENRKPKNCVNIFFVLSREAQICFREKHGCASRKAKKINSTRSTDLLLVEEPIGK